MPETDAWEKKVREKLRKIAGDSESEGDEEGQKGRKENTSSLKGDKKKKSETPKKVEKDATAKTSGQSKKVQKDGGKNTTTNSKSEAGSEGEQEDKATRKGTKRKSEQHEEQVQQKPKKIVKKKEESKDQLENGDEEEEEEEEKRSKPKPSTSKRSRKEVNEEENQSKDKTPKGNVKKKDAKATEKGKVRETQEVAKETKTKQQSSTPIAKSSTAKKTTNKAKTPINKEESEEESEEEKEVKPKKVAKKAVATKKEEESSGEEKGIKQSKAKKQPATPNTTSAKKGKTPTVEDEVDEKPKKKATSTPTSKTASSSVKKNSTSTSKKDKSTKEDDDEKKSTPKRPAVPAKFDQMIDWLLEGDEEEEATKEDDSEESDEEVEEGEEEDEGEEDDEEEEEEEQEDKQIKPKKPTAIKTPAPANTKTPANPRSSTPPDSSEPKSSTLVINKKGTIPHWANIPPPPPALSSAYPFLPTTLSSHDPTTTSISSSLDSANMPPNDIADQLSYNDLQYVLLGLELRRRAAKGWYWSPCGGKKEEGEDIEDTCTREFSEETGGFFDHLIPELRENLHRESTYKFYITAGKECVLFTPIEFDPTIPEKFKTWVDQLVEVANDEGASEDTKQHAHAQLDKTGKRHLMWVNAKELARGSSIIESTLSAPENQGYDMHVYPYFLSTLKRPAIRLLLSVLHTRPSLAELMTIIESANRFNIGMFVMMDSESPNAQLWTGMQNLSRKRNHPSAKYGQQEDKYVLPRHKRNLQPKDSSVEEGTTEDSQNEGAEEEGDGDQPERGEQEEEEEEESDGGKKNNKKQRKQKNPETSRGGLSAKARRLEAKRIGRIQKIERRRQEQSQTRAAEREENKRRKEKKEEDEPKGRKQKKHKRDEWEPLNHGVQILDASAVDWKTITEREEKRQEKRGEATLGVIQDEDDNEITIVDPTSFSFPNLQSIYNNTTPQPIEETTQPLVSIAKNKKGH